ncbi:MAG: hypothetical protein CJBNEKGG_01628 [Prosthecobacter sp.]|nr:hypothetical protein [Prosthecobacter sp.]
MIACEIDGETLHIPQSQLASDDPATLGEEQVRRRMNGWREQGGGVGWTPARR